MADSLGAQVGEFLLFILVGVGMAAALHLHQRVVEHLRLTGLLLWLFDFILWPFLGLLVFALLLLVNQGDLHLRLFMALVCGALIYLARLRPRWSLFIDRLARRLAGTARSLVRRVWRPGPHGGGGPVIPPDGGQGAL